MAIFPLHKKIFFGCKKRGNLKGNDAWNFRALSEKIFSVFSQNCFFSQL
jgi:hypothetical protein